MNPIATIDLLTVGVSLAAIVLLIFGFRRIGAQLDTRCLLAGFLILSAAYHISLYLEWRNVAGGDPFDRIENFVGTLTPMAWFLIAYSLIKEVAARDMRENEHKLRSFLDHHLEFTGIVDPDGRIVLANKTALDYISASSEDVVGTLLWETPWFYNNETTRAMMIDHFNTARSGRVSRFATEMDIDDGTKRHFDISINPFLDGDGRIQWLVVEARDITDLRKAEGLVEETLNLSKTILYKINLRSGRFEYVSPYIESVTGFPATHFVDKGLPWVMERLHPRDSRRIGRINRDILHRTVADGADLEYELRFKGKDDTFDWYKTRLTIRFGEHGRAESLIGSIERITEQIRGRGQLPDLVHAARLGADLPGYSLFSLLRR